MAVHLLGIRHHGPGSARSVVKAFDELQPDIVLVEAPAETTAALAWIGDEQLVPPVALLGHVVDHPHRAAFAPLASFSPEWQAVAWANAHGVEVRAIDLPLANTLTGAADDAGLDELRADRWRAGRSDRPLALAAAAGEPDAERWWDDVVEHRGDGLVAFEAVAEAMAAVRAGTVPSLGEQRREAHMRRAIRAAVNEGYATVAVVCGAWHVPALDIAATSATADNATLRGLPQGQGRGQLGAVDTPAPRRGHRVRRRGSPSGMVRPRVPPSRARRCHPVLRRRRPPAARRRHGGLARPPHRRVADGRDAVGPARSPASRSRRGARLRRRGAWAACRSCGGA